MLDLVQLVQEADIAIIEMEQSRAAVDAAKFGLEAAKEEFERARSNFDQVIAKADEINVPRVKLRKLVEERSAAFLASGLLSTPVNQPKIPKAPKAPKKQKAQAADGDDLDFDAPIRNCEGEPAHLDA